MSPPNNDPFERELLIDLCNELSGRLRNVYGATRPMPFAADTGKVLPIGDRGCGMAGLPALWDRIVAGSTKLASPWMSGHMDSAPHPAAALTQALVAALNNNLLFRELSPFASQVEDDLSDFFCRQLELSDDWLGIFASGGSVANLSALFAACGGYESTEERTRVRLLVPASAHVSLIKAAAILGISSDRLIQVACDDAGRLDLEALASCLNDVPADASPIVVSVLGTTIHGSVDSIEHVARLCQQRNAWHHVDAIYGGGLAFSHLHRQLLRGLHKADSIAIGPQKWMYVPRVSALILLRGRERADRRLGVSLPYSLGEMPHRGRWGIQGSRPADAVTLWATLQVMGTRRLGEVVDSSIALTKTFHRMLCESDQLQPTHVPDLNLQVFRAGPTDSTGERLTVMQRHLTERGGTWASVSRWNEEALLRMVLLSPSLDEAYLTGFVTDLEGALKSSTFT